MAFFFFLEALFLVTHTSYSYFIRILKIDNRIFIVAVFFNMHKVDSELCLK